MKRVSVALLHCTSLLLFCALCLSCGRRSASLSSQQQPPVFPDYAGVTVPCNIAPLNLCVSGSAHHMRVIWRMDGKDLLVAEGTDHTDIALSEWQGFLLKAKGKNVEVAVEIWNDSFPQGIAYQPFRLHVDDSAIDPYLTYRLIPPGYIGWNKMELAQRCLSSFEESVLVSNLQNGGGCLNCHTSCKGNPSQYLFHSRCKTGGTVISDRGRMVKKQISSPLTGRNAVYPAWHPAGRWIAFSTDDVHQSFYNHCRSKIEVYNNSGDLLLYDTRTERVVEDVRFCDTVNVKTFPAFSPDGKWLYFCTSKRYDVPFCSDSMHYSLVRVSFEASTGKLGEVVDTIYNARVCGGSASLPRISPDGRWLLFTWAECNAFPIQHPESSLCLVDLKTYKVSEPPQLISSEADTYHSWSSNGRWIVFASRRKDGRVTRLYIAAFSNGQFGRPFLLPQRYPAEDVLRRYSYNVPELLKGKIKTDKDEMARLLQSP